MPTGYSAMLLSSPRIVMTYSQDAVDLIKHFEGCRCEAYQDIAGVWTIGYGCTAGVHGGMRIDLTEADVLLRSALDKTAGCVNRLLKAPVAQHHLDALLSFSYNLGCGALAQSTLLHLVNDGQMQAAAQEFPKWCRSGGRIVPGLVKRREAERNLFLSGALTLI